MKLFDGGGPNPKVVRMFLAEKGLDLPKTKVDIVTAENRKPEHVARNPLGTIPVLELDTGAFISEVTAICEYLEEKHPTPPLIGTTAEERAETRMWTRRVDLQICEPMANGFRFGEGADFFKGRIQVEPDASSGLKRIAQANLKWLDNQLSGRTWIVGNRFSLADIQLYAFQSFFARQGQPIDPAFSEVAAWFERVKERPTAKA